MLDIDWDDDDDEPRDFAREVRAILFSPESPWL